MTETAVQKNALQPHFNAVVFDIDNVLIDTRASYVNSIRWTIEIFLTSGTIPLFSPEGKTKGLSLLTVKDVEAFKLLGGFNDDWDCCYGLLVYLLNLPVKSRTLSSLRKAIDLDKFSAQITKRPLCVRGITALLGRPSAVTIEKISRIFQEVYLGKELFHLVEKKKNVYWKKRGLINREKLVFRRSTLARLVGAGVKLGVATGRPRFEAVYALKRFGILEFFQAITTINEVKRAEQEMRQSLRKPNPFSILATAKKMDPKARYLYVGDLPDDILAANGAKSTLDIRSVAFPLLAANYRNTLAGLQKVRPDYILRRPSDLANLVLRRRQAVKAGS